MQRIGNRQDMGGSQQCQKCLKYGHWTFECTNQRSYQYRPSRTTVERNPHLKAKEIFEKGPVGPKIHDGDWKRSTRKKSSSSSDSDSDSEESEGEQLQKELSKLINEHKKV